MRPDRPTEARETPGEREWSRPIGRAAFLATVAAGIGGIAVAPSLSRAIGDRLNRVLPAGVADLLPIGGWRIYSVNPPMPRFDPQRYRLRITGAVHTPVELTWERVLALPRRSVTADFHCVTGWSVEDVPWEGIAPETVMDLARPRPEARYVTFVSLETPYEDQLTLEQFLLGDNVVAHTMYGRPIRREHGAPVRMVIPRMYGYKGVKWLGEIRFDTAERPGYWERRGYDTDAWVGGSNGRSA
jgi:DMSO/TMAO reductase YedYZ molybdopterin-dependent catalytic subunit